MPRDLGSSFHRLLVVMGVLDGLILVAGLSVPSTARPKAVVFDLDGCLWYPDMYMLWGGGAPFSPREDGDLDDQYGKKVYLLGDVRNMSNVSIQIIADHCPSLRSLSIAGNMQAMDLDVADVCKRATVLPAPSARARVRELTGSRIRHYIMPIVSAALPRNSEPNGGGRSRRRRRGARRESSSGVSVVGYEQLHSRVTA